MNLFVQCLLHLTDMYQSDTHSMVWRGTQLHTMFGTTPGQRHCSSSHIQLTLVPLVESKPNNHWQQHVKYIKHLRIDYIFNQELAVKNTIHGLTLAGWQLHNHWHITLNVELGHCSKLCTYKVMTSPSHGHPSHMHRQVQQRIPP